jgi:murein DD-endopeptidase MepM/ murein hydrolase activator NlpD
MMKYSKSLFSAVFLGLSAGGIASGLLAGTGCASSTSTLNEEPTTITPGPSEDLYEPFTGEVSEETVPPNADSPAVGASKSKTSKHQFDWPVDEARMTRGYLPNKKRPHLGVDLAARKGTPILASQDGMVIYTGRDFKGFGKMVLIEGKGGWATLYAHFSKIHVREGQKVKQGDVIGSMGRTGRATGVHLHFEIRRDRGPVDPLLYLPAGTKLVKI